MSCVLAKEGRSRNTDQETFSSHQDWKLMTSGKNQDLLTLLLVSALKSSPWCWNEFFTCLEWVWCYGKSRVSCHLLKFAWDHSPVFVPTRTVHTKSVQTACTKRATWTLVYCTLCFSYPWSYSLSFGCFFFNFFKFSQIQHTQELPHLLSGSRHHVF